MIPTRDRPEVLERTIAALAAQSLDKDAFEVVVVDNGSEPGALERARALRGSAAFALEVLSEPRPGGSAARNAGVSVASSEHVLFLGDDTRPAAPGFLSGHLAALAGRGDGPPAAVLGGCVWAPGVEVTPVMDWLERTGKILDYSAMDAGEGPLANLYAGNLSMRRSDLVAVGGFDERFSKIYGWADYDLALRLGDRGLRLVFRPDLIVHHDHRYGLRDSLRRMEAMGRTANLLNRIHGGRPGLATPRPIGVKALVGSTLAPLTVQLPVPSWLPRPVRDAILRVWHYAALARGYRRPPLDDDPAHRGGLRERSPA